MRTSLKCTIYFKNIQLVSLCVIAACTCTFADIEYRILYRTGDSKILSETSLQKLVYNALSDELNSGEWSRAKINAFINQPRQDFLIVNLVHKSEYRMHEYKLLISNAKVTKVLFPYFGDELYQRAGKEDCAVCPDPDIDVVISHINDFPTAITSGKLAYELVTKAGQKAVRLDGSDESLLNIKSYLKCPKLKMWGRIGHGNMNSILLGDGTSLTTSTIAALNSDIKNKIFIFTSSSGMGQFQAAMLGAKAYFFASVSGISVNGEKVMPLFCGNAPLGGQLDSLMDAIDFDKSWSYCGAAPKPWLYKYAGGSTDRAPGTRLLNPKKITVTVEKSYIKFTIAESGNKYGLLSVYELNGRLLYQTKISPNKSVQSITWDLKTVQGKKISRGTYLVSYSNEINLAKVFIMPD